MQYISDIRTHKKSLKIPKEESESVNQWKTDNTMTKRKKKTKGQTRIYQISHIKLNNISGDRDLLHINPTTMRYHDEIYLKIGYHTDIWSQYCVCNFTSRTIWFNSRFLLERTSIANVIICFCLDQHSLLFWTLWPMLTCSNENINIKWL